MHSIKIGRRGLIVGRCRRPPPRSRCAPPAFGAGAEGAGHVINIVDVAGELALTQDAIEAYEKKNPSSSRSTSRRRRRPSCRAS